MVPRNIGNVGRERSRRLDTQGDTVMCGRFALYSPYPSLAASLRLPLEATEADLVPRYNVAPGTWVSAVRRIDYDGLLVLDAMWWGYNPHWVDAATPEPMMACVENVMTSIEIRDDFGHRRRQVN